ncbi:hypothetical protein BH24ACI4_BH24ACI4_21070 [soil metagenome]
MMMPALLVVALLQAPAGQSGAQGVWQAQYTTLEGRLHRFTLTLKESDSALAGTISSPRGSVAITEGTVRGREIGFTVRRRASYDEIDVVFKGNIGTDRMQLTMQVGAREPVAVTASRDTAAPSQ